MIRRKDSGVQERGLQKVQEWEKAKPFIGLQGSRGMWSVKNPCCPGGPAGLGRADLRQCPQGPCLQGAGTAVVLHAPPPPPRPHTAMPQTISKPEGKRVTERLARKEPRMVLRTLEVLAPII